MAWRMVDGKLQAGVTNRTAAITNGYEKVVSLPVEKRPELVEKAASYRLDILGVLSSKTRTTDTVKLLKVRKLFQK